MQTPKLGKIRIQEKHLFLKKSKPDQGLYKQLNSCNEAENVVGFN